MSCKIFSHHDHKNLLHSLATLLYWSGADFCGNSRRQVFLKHYFIFPAHNLPPVMTVVPATGFGLRLDQWIAWLGLAAVGCTWFDKQRVSLSPAVPVLAIIWSPHACTILEFVLFVEIQAVRGEQKYCGRT